MSYETREGFAKESSEWYRFLRGMIRRVAVTLTSSVKWQILGQRGGSGGDETADLEPFTGIGFYSRPPANGKPEAIVTAYGSAKGAAIVATRDEATRKVGAGDLDEDETCVYNGSARMYVKKDGTVEIRLHGGAAVKLATNDDLAALINIIASTVDGSGALKAAVTAYQGSHPSWPAGTSVLKGQ